MTMVQLPRFDDTGGVIGEDRIELGPPGPWTQPQRPIASRVAFAAAHVVPLVGAENVPGAPAVVDWDATIALRERIWSYGLGVADAMDTAQRGMGLDWAATQELVRRSGAAARACGGRLACGAGTDQLAAGSVPDGPAGLGMIVDAYAEQIELVQQAGAQVIVMASRELARVARCPEDYAAVYDAVLARLDQPAILHWLGTAFDPALAGYWGSQEIGAATASFVDLVRAHRDRIDGVKVSLLDSGHERGLRRSLRDLGDIDGRPVRLYTGDDFHYPELVAGDEDGHSDALLGIFAAIYPAASTALQALDDGDVATGRAILDRTQEFGRHVFAAPTFYYKTGIAFWSWLNGFQPGFQLIGGLHSARSVPHLVRLFRLADEAGLLLHPELAADRIGSFLSVNGVTR